jgi:hypothetical protein
MLTPIGIAMAAARSYAMSLAHELRPTGVYVGHVAIATYIQPAPRATPTRSPRRTGRCTSSASASSTSSQVLQLLTRPVPMTKRNDLRAGLLSVTFRAFDADRIIALARDARLAAIEWGGDVHVPHGDVETAARVRDACAAAGLTVSAYGSYYRAGATAGPSLENVLDPPSRWPRRSCGSGRERKARRDVARRTGCRRGGPAPRLRASGRPWRADRAGVSREHLTDDADACVALLRAVPRRTSRRSGSRPTACRPKPRVPGSGRCCRGSRTCTSSTGGRRTPSVTRSTPARTAGGRFLNIVRDEAPPAQRFASLEFVRAESVEQFQSDARTLRGWLDDER